MPPPALPPSARPLENRIQTKEEESTIYSLFERLELRSVRTNVTRAPCRRHPDDRADRPKIPDRIGDMIAADHKVQNEEQEFKLHHK